MSDFYKRLSQLSEYKGFKSINKFALDGLNYTSSEKLNRLKKENASPSFEILNDISNKFEDVNMNWLLTGKGEMLKDISSSKNVDQVNESETIYSKEPNLLAAQQKTISILETVVIELRTDVVELRNDKKLLVDVLKRQIFDRSEKKKQK